MVLINDNWQPVESLHDISKIIRENLNVELADELDSLIPEHDDAEYEELQWELDHKEDKIRDLENETDDLEKENDRLSKIEDRVDKAIDLAWDYGQIDGDHHKMWVIDQMVRIIFGDKEKYKEWVNEYEKTDEYGDKYSWEIGIAP